MTNSPRLPAGTQVVLREASLDHAGARVQRGATGRVIGDAESGGYLIRLSDGRQLTAGRAELALRKAHQQATGVGDAATEDHRFVTDHTIYAAVVGSRAFGLDTAESDTDVRGVYAAPADAFWSLRKPPPHVDGPEPEQFSWEVERFCELALKANPNLLEVLHSPLVRTVTPLGEELLELRGAFLSQLVYQTYSGYVLSQFKKIEADIRRDGEPRWKHVMHLLRLLLACRDVLSTGSFRTDAGDNREDLLRVRRGERSWPEVEAWRLALHAEIDDALDRTPLPAGPDTKRVDDWLRSVRARSAAEFLR
ncbi:nucleotidyltransferase domain-containing protein [Catenuloplanes japonicus]|uniref:nucleotidyltransferase domain-containing protein n=1 Tax=Catenuloplanes japonicus TaxID=33876 RepID=UPI000A0FFEE8|nr:nucleotidyltransferase domain-containing protein [Catenuloplanes japonicus]